MSVRPISAEMLARILRGGHFIPSNQAPIALVERRLNSRSIK